jgi:methyl-accepting chemotaxis protein
MAKLDGVTIFVAGIGIGVAATLLLKDRELRNRVGNALSNGSRTVTDRLSDALSDAEGTLRKGEKLMSDVKTKVKNQIDDTAAGAKKVVDKVADKSKEAAHQAKEAAHQAGEHLERGGKRLQDA